MQHSNCELEMRSAPAEGLGWWSLTSEDIEVQISELDQIYVIN